MGKSAAQIRRLQKRAQLRGEEYIPPPIPEKQDDDGKMDNASSENLNSDSAGSSSATPVADPESAAEKEKLAVAQKLLDELESIETRGLKSKEKRSAKKKAEAIAAVEAGIPAKELMEWFEEYQKKRSRKANKNNTTKSNPKSRTPYIVFVGQLSYESTKESLFAHIKKELKEHKITDKTLKIRLLTDPKTKKSKGMAFCEVFDPELQYALLKLHQTFLEGRRLNVERTAGGRKSSESRKAKIQQHRTEQDAYMGKVVEQIFDEFYQRKEIQRGEVDEGAIALCTRHSTTIVQAALEQYVESSGSSKDNPSAYLSFLLGKLAEEGIFEKEEKDQQHKAKRQRTSGDDRR